MPAPARFQRAVHCLLDASSCQVPDVCPTSAYRYSEERDGYGCEGYYYGGEDEAEGWFGSGIFGQPQKQTIAAGTFSPCGTFFITISSMEAESQLEHWKLSKAGSEIKCAMEVVKRLMLPSQMFRPKRYHFSWHPTLASKLYALIEGSTVHVIDGCQHGMILSIPTYGFCVPQISVEEPISWSPNGVRLAVIRSEHVNIVQADVL